MNRATGFEHERGHDFVAHRALPGATASCLPPVAEWGESGAMRKWLLPFALLVVLAAALFAGSEVREHFGADFSVAGLEALRDWTVGLGWLGPATFVAFVTFRHFLLLPSTIVLILGGLAFGVLGGILWGSLGLVLCSLGQFLAARILGEEWVRSRLLNRHEVFTARIRRLGPAPVFLSAAYPVGPMTPVNLAAGLVGLPTREFLLAVSAGAPVRAGICSALGTAILGWGPATLIQVGLGLFFLVSIPLLIPRFRNWLFGMAADSPRDQHDEGFGG